jgi:hypothetical protein
MLAVAPACGQRCQHDKGNSTSTKGDNASTMLVKTCDDVMSQVASPVGQRRATLPRRATHAKGTFAKYGVVAGEGKTTKDGDFTKKVDYAKDRGQFCGGL